MSNILIKKNAPQWGALSCLNVKKGLLNEELFY